MTPAGYTYPMPAPARIQDILPTDMESKVPDAIQLNASIITLASPFPFLLKFQLGSSRRIVTTDNIAMRFRQASGTQTYCS